MSATGFENNVLLFAGVIVPDLNQKKALHKPFLNNFDKLLRGIEADSFEKIKLLVKVIGVLSLIYTRKSFQNLSIKKRERFVDRLYHFPVSKIVGGLTGLKSLVFIAYYGIEDVWKEIHYDGPIVSN